MKLQPIKINFYITKGMKQIYLEEIIYITHK